MYINVNALMWIFKNNVYLLDALLEMFGNLLNINVTKVS